MKEVYGSMALDTKKLYTTKDVMALPEGVRAELIDGEIFYMATPNTIHQALLAEYLMYFCAIRKATAKNAELTLLPLPYSSTAMSTTTWSRIF